MAPTDGSDSPLPAVTLPRMHSWCCYEPGPSYELAQDSFFACSSPTSAPAPVHLQYGGSQPPERDLPSQVHSSRPSPHLHPHPQAQLLLSPDSGENANSLGASTLPPVMTQPDSQKHISNRPKARRSAKEFTVNELFSLIKTVNEIDIYGAPFGQTGARWEQIRQAHEGNGYTRPTKSLRAKVEELLAYHLVCFFLS